MSQEGYHESFSFRISGCPLLCPNTMNTFNYPLLFVWICFYERKGGKGRRGEWKRERRMRVTMEEGDFPIKCCLWWNDCDLPWRSEMKGNWGTFRSKCFHPNLVTKRMIMYFFISLSFPSVPSRFLNPNTPLMFIDGNSKTEWFPGIFV